MQLDPLYEHEKVEIAYQVQHMSIGSTEAHCRCRYDKHIMNCPHVHGTGDCVAEKAVPTKEERERAQKEKQSQSVISVGIDKEDLSKLRQSSVSETNRNTDTY